MPSIRETSRPPHQSPSANVPCRQPKCWRLKEKAKCGVDWQSAAPRKIVTAKFNRRERSEQRPSFTSFASVQLIPASSSCIFVSCRSTNFIARNASGTAKSLSAPATGRARNAHIAAQRNCPRNSPPSPRPAPAPPARLRPATAAADIVAAAVVTATESWRRSATVAFGGASVLASRIESFGEQLVTSLVPFGFIHSDKAWTVRMRLANAGFRAPRRPRAALPRYRTGSSPGDS